MCHYHKIINNDNLDTICNECKTGSRGCVQCKKELINNMTEFLKDYREKRSYYENNSEEVKKILQEGTIAAKKQAEETMKKVRASMKLDYLDK